MQKLQEPEKNTESIDVAFVNSKEKSINPRSNISSKNMALLPVPSKNPGSPIQQELTPKRGFPFSKKEHLKKHQ